MRAGSQAQIDRLYKAAGTVYLQNDLIAVMGMHDASPTVVAWLEGRVASGDRDDLRAEATEWIAYHPIPRSIAALDRIARGGQGLSGAAGSGGSARRSRDAGRGTRPHRAGAGAGG